MSDAFQGNCSDWQGHTLIRKDGEDESYQPRIEFHPYLTAGRNGNITDRPTNRRSIAMQCGVVSNMHRLGAAPGSLIRPFKQEATSMT